MPSTKPQAGVMATKPAIAPEMMPSTDGLLWTIHSMNIHDSAAAAVATNGDHDHAGTCTGAESRTDVEAEPADPQQRSADQAEHQVMRRHVFGAVPDTFAEEEAGHETGDAGVDMHHRTAGEVENAGFEETAAPDPSDRPGRRRSAPKVP